MKFNRFVIPLLFPVAVVACAQDEVQVVENPVDYVTTLMGTLSDHSFSTGNTYPATAVPWGMNFWTPQTGPMGDGWTYSYDAHLIRGLKQTMHQRLTRMHAQAGSPTRARQQNRIIIRCILSIMM